VLLGEESLGHIFAEVEALALKRLHQISREANIRAYAVLIEHLVEVVEFTGRALCSLFLLRVILFLILLLLLYELKFREG